MSRIWSLVVACTLVVLACPSAGATADTTPPTLVALTVSPQVVDASAAAQPIVVSAGITDDLSGVGSASVQVISPDGNQHLSGRFTLGTSGSYVVTLQIPRYSHEGAWTLSMTMTDLVGNTTSIDTGQLSALGFNDAIGVGHVPDAYERTVTLQLSPNDVPERASGELTGDATVTCITGASIVLERKTDTGWKRLGTSVLDKGGRFNFAFHAKAGKYRATATSFVLGVPPVTTCARARVTARSGTSGGPK